MNHATRRRAEKAARLLKALAASEEIIHARHGLVYRLPDRSLFNDRELDTCFEMGDGDDVVRHLLHLVDTDPALALAVSREPASRYVALDLWRARYRTGDAPTVENDEPFCLPLAFDPSPT